MTTAVHDAIRLEAPAREGGFSFASCDLIPERGMMVFQVRARRRDAGLFDILASPPLEEGLARLDGGPDDFAGSASFSMGGAFLVPYANRIRGRLVPRRRIEAQIAGRPVLLPANGAGKRPGAEPCAIHGLILDRPVGDIQRHDLSGGQTASAVLKAGDFQGGWLSRTDVAFEITMTSEAFRARLTVSNVGPELLPVGVGWHPYFAIPSGERGQARLKIPAAARLAVNNYDDVFPTGDAVPVEGTPYDFRGPRGGAAGELYLDDCLTELEKAPDGATVCEMLDPAAGYGLRLAARSPQVTAVQTYGPPDKPFLVMEPQFNFADPYGVEWRGRETGMVTLEPSESVDYEVELTMFEVS
jgi:aldose 1-epimerase